jgi:hypothetical protein
MKLSWRALSLERVLRGRGVPFVAAIFPISVAS